MREQSFTTQKERTIKMPAPRKVTKLEKILFPIVVTLVVVRVATGAELSTINCPLVLVVTFVFHALSYADHDSTHK